MSLSRALGQAKACTTNEVIHGKRPARTQYPQACREGRLITERLNRSVNAATVGAINFILLILVGVAFAHKAQTRAMIGRVFHRARRR